MEVQIKPDDVLISLTQKLFTEAGHQGNVYKAEPRVLRYFENKAIEILEGENNAQVIKKQYERKQKPIRTSEEMVRDCTEVLKSEGE